MAKSKTKELTFERTYPVPVETVWQAWTDPDHLREWWGADKTVISECEIDLRVGGRLYVEVEGGPKMGKYAGMRWPMEGTFTVVEPCSRLVYEAQSWTEGERETSTIDQVNDLTLAADGDATKMTLRVKVTKTGRGATLAITGMKWGYNSQFKKLAARLEHRGER